MVYCLQHCCLELCDACDTRKKPKQQEIYTEELHVAFRKRKTQSRDFDHFEFIFIGGRDSGKKYELFLVLSLPAFFYKFEFGYLWQCGCISGSQRFPSRGQQHTARQGHLIKDCLLLLQRLDEMWKHVWWGGLYLDRPLFNEHTYFTQGYVHKRGQISRRTSHSITVFDRGENDHPQSKREYWTKIITSIWPHVPLVYYDYTKANRRILFFREKSKECPKSSFSR